MDTETNQFPAPADEFYAAPQSLFTEPPPQRSLSQRVFIGPYGLRAGWSLLIYFAIIASIIFAVRGVHEHYKAKARAEVVAAAKAEGKPIPPETAVKHDSNEPMPLLAGAAQEGISFGVILLVTLLMSFIERRRFAVYGLGGQRSVGRFLVGAVWGVIALSLVIGSLRLMHMVTFDAQLDHGWQILGWGAAQLGLFLLVGLLEEYMFRGYIQFTLMRGMVGLGNRISPLHGKAVAFWIATVITSALFLLAHTGNSGETALGLFQVFLAGLVFVVALWRTGSLWWAIGFHMAWDWSQSFLYGVPDSGMLAQGRMFATHSMGNPLLSGGPDGPEGSVLCIPVLLLTIIVLVFFTKSSPQPELETEPQGRPEEMPEPVTLEA
jgi:uncharacterized protein